MRWKAMAGMMLLAPWACGHGSISEGSSVPNGLSSYRTAVLQTTVARGVEATPAEIAEFESDLEKRLRQAEVFGQVSRDAAGADLAIRMEIEEAATHDTTPLLGGGSQTATVKVDVELVDTIHRRGVGRFAIQATNKDSTFAAFEIERSSFSLAFRNASRGIVRRLREAR